MTASKNLLLALIAALTLTGCPPRESGSGNAGSGVVDPSADTAVSAGARAKIRTTLVELEKAAKAHDATEGQPPADLDALIAGGHWHDKDRKDPWGNDWVLVVSGNDVTAWCYGKDAAPGGEGINEDYKSH
jgi:hypothetical protein